MNLTMEQLEGNAGIFYSPPEKYSHCLGELYFCRAYMYAYMVKCFGGVPIVKNTVSYTDLKEEELYIPRNTEKEVVDFIAEDLDKAMELMGADELMSGRANRFVAANLKARRSEERGVGEECVSTCSSRWWRYHKKNTNNNQQENNK